MTFEDALPAWQQWQASPAGRLRYTLGEANLLRHLPDAPQRVLDLAGADGGDALWLAARGHHVTIVDFTPIMLVAAQERARAAGLSDLISCVEADVMRLPADIGEYDVVLCHNLLQYQKDSSAALTAAVKPVRPGGLFSVMAINRHAEPLSVAIRTHDLAAARAALDTDQAYTHTLHSKVTLHTAEEISADLTGLGCEILGHYGIRSVCDYVTDDDRKHDPAFYAELERLELALTDRPPFQHTARIFQLVARSAGLAAHG